MKLSLTAQRPRVMSKWASPWWLEASYNSIFLSSTVSLLHKIVSKTKRRVTTIVVSLPLSCHYHCRVITIVVSLPLSCHYHCHVTTIVVSLRLSCHYHCHGQSDTDELRIFEFFCRSQKLACRWANTGVCHWYLLVNEKAPIKGNVITWGPLIQWWVKWAHSLYNSAVQPKIILEKCSEMYGTEIITILSAFMPNCCAVTHCIIDSTTFFFIPEQKQNIHFVQSDCYTLSFIAHS